MLFNKIERKTLSENLGKRNIVLHENKLGEKVHIDKSPKCTIKKSEQQI